MFREAVIPFILEICMLFPDRCTASNCYWGREINILDGEGNLDMDENCMRMLDIRIAGIHSLCYSYGTVDENTHGMVKAVSNPFIHIISHPEMVRPN